MANDNKKSNNLVSQQDDDPTAELEILSAADISQDDVDVKAERETDANTFDFDKPQSDVGDADETIANLKLDLKSRAESIRKFQFDIEQLRSKWSGLEKEIKVREEVTKNLTSELKATNKKHTRAAKLVKKRDKEIASLRSKLADRERALQDSARLIEQSKKQEKASESGAAEIQLRLQEAEEKLATLSAEAQLEHSQNQESTEQLKSRAAEIESLNENLAVSAASVTELQSYIDSRKSDWERQQAQLVESKNRIKELESELRDDGSVYDDMSARLTSLEAERDELLAEIARLRKDVQGGDAERVAADKKLLASQTGKLAGKDFEISELNGQISRTEAYADELRRQLQDQLLLTDELQSRQKHLEISLTSSNSKVQELADSMEELRASNSELLQENSRLTNEFEKEVRRIRFELGEAQETIADRESINQQLTSDLLDTREFKMNLESQLSASEDKNAATISGLKQELTQLETHIEELSDKLTTKDNAISALLSELTKRSEAIESIVEIEDVIHDLDDRMSEQIDDRGNVERERITRLLVGRIDGQKLRFPLFKNRLTIGRTGHNDIQLKAPFISRRHAVIVSDGGNTRIVDWGSKNGVFVNTKQIKEKVLKNGDIVTIGTADFKFEERPKR